MSLTHHPSPHWIVTGAAGFIGARLVERCNKNRIQLTSVDDLDAFSSREEHQSLDFGQKISKDHFIDLLASGKLATPDAMIHLGACSSTTEMNIDFLRKVNIEYSQSLWNYCSRKKIPFIYASSAATYGNGDQGYSDDESTLSRLHPLNPYGESKRLFDLWAIEEVKKQNHPPVWSGHKFFNVYGFGERHKGSQASVVIHAYDQIRNYGSVKLFQSHRPGIDHGEQKRDFIWVEDVIDVLEFALRKPLQSGIYNLGTGKARSFLDLARAVFAALQLPEKIEFIPTPESIRERYQYFTEAQMSKLRNAGYSKPFTSLEVGVRQTVEALLDFDRRRTTTNTPTT